MPAAGRSASSSTRRGGLLVADDVGNVIWRVSTRSQPPRVRHQENSHVPARRPPDRARRRHRPLPWQSSISRAVRRRRPALAILHGALAVFRRDRAPARTCGKSGFGGALLGRFLLFVVAALGGLYLVSHHMRQKPLPNGVVVIHGLVAVIAFLVLADRGVPRALRVRMERPARGAWPRCVRACCRSSRR